MHHWRDIKCLKCASGASKLVPFYFAIVFFADVFPKAETICNQNYLFKMLKAMFPCISKSKMNDRGIFKMSVKGIKFDSHPSTSVSLADIEQFVPNNGIY